MIQPMQLIPDQYEQGNLDDKTFKWIKATLSNDENSTNQELVEYFTEEGRLTKEEAELWVSRRSFYLNNIVEE